MSREYTNEDRMMAWMKITDVIKAMRSPGMKAMGYVMMTGEDGCYIQLVKKDVIAWLKDSCEMDPEMMVTAWIEDKQIHFN